MGAISDRLWFALDHSIPNWDQADYLTGALNYWQALQTPQWFSNDWWTHLWQLSSKIPPLFYISTAPFLSLFGAGVDQSTLVNLLFSAILLSSVYLIGVCLLTVPAALWAVGLCLLMPGLYRVRLDFLLDFPLTALVTLCYACLTVWREKGRRIEDKGLKIKNGSNSSLHSSFILLDWLLVVAIGLTLGLALMVKQPALLFLFVPLVWVGIETLWQRAWVRLLQLVFAVCLSMLIWVPWYRTNWLLMLSATKRATIDSAIAEHDPSLLSLDAWTYYLKALPVMISLPLLLMPLVGFLCFWRRSRVSSHCAGEMDFSPKTKRYRQQIYGASKEAVGWLFVYCISGYLLSSLNVNKDDRYVVPYLPIVALLLGYGITLLPKRWQLLQWGLTGLAIVLMCSNLVVLPLGRTLQPTSFAQHFAYTGAAYPHTQVIDSVLQAQPYLRSTIGVLPSTGQINQHNINYYGNLQNFRVYGRQVGTRKSQVEQDQRSLSWFLTKTDDQGAIRQQDSQTALVKTVEQGTDFTLHKTWTLPDRSTLKLFRRTIPLLEVMPVMGKSEVNGQPSTVSGQQSVDSRQHIELKTQNSLAFAKRVFQTQRRNALLKTSPASSASPASPAPITLDQVIVPDRAPPGKPIPVTYRWSGNWDALRSGLVILTWHKQGNLATSERWLHDHGIGMGLLHPKVLPMGSATRFQVVERLSMLPPQAVSPGTYTLEATYLNRQTGQAAAIATPPISLRLVANTAANPAPELDLVTQLRTLATALPKGGKALDPVFDQIGRINQYDPTQDYAEQARQAMTYRLTQEPKNREFAYTLALSTVLKRRVGDAIATLQQVVQLDAQNPYAYGYLAFINLYDFRAGAAQAALNTALKLNPKLPELHALSGVAALMQVNLVRAWQEFQRFEALEKQSS
ncbi:MAG: phospholipid carrier-dependent glycosyltransferase [Stenomitos rutilans HA7619-LM2]|jgi:4-amino-4-deoxy-L-arabinose transferase-like glycosyltransferase|nr:phospholipid carrier-dependent glycosyltransferase [Stenomitos rutilans HA7619-LM2]